MRDIADRVGVSTATVSRVLSGKRPGSASSATATEIRRVADALGYQPDPWAASLRTQRTRAIGVLIPRLADHLLAYIFEALEKHASDAGYQVLVAATGDDHELQRRRIELFEARRVDGLIVMTANRGEDAYFDSLRDRGVPFVLANRAVGDHVVIRADDHQGGYLASEHLLALGHRRIGVIAGPETAPTAHERVLGYRDALKAAGIEPDPQLVVPSGVEVEDGEIATRTLLARRNPPTAIFAVNDLTAIGAMGVLREAGIAPGRRFGLVGYNDLPLSSRLPIPLSSVWHPVEDIGRLAFDALLSLLAGDRPASQTLGVRLRVRESSTA